jgi:hypothetical protein
VHSMTFNWTELSVEGLKCVNHLKRASKGSYWTA